MKRVSSHLVNADKVQTRAMRLFESCLLIGLTLIEENGTKKNLPYVKSFFPAHVKPPPLIEFFCFPDADIFPKLSQQQQTYSIVLTNERGGRKFGYCRRVLPEGSHICLPLAYCIVSPHRAPGFFFTVGIPKKNLNEIWDSLNVRKINPQQFEQCRLLAEKTCPNFLKFFRYLRSLNLDTDRLDLIHLCGNSMTTIFQTPVKA